MLIIFDWRRGVMPAEGMVLHDSLSIDNTATVRDALKLFNKNGTSNAPIIDKHGAIIAFLSVGDVLREFGNEVATAALADFYSYVPDLLFTEERQSEENRFRKILDQKVTSIATKRVVFVDASASFKEVCQALSERHIKKVPVLKQGKLIGTINRKDIVNHILVNLAE
ncbi:MAG: CBS domain-containing protein [Mobiluncus sp.]|uniref:CBS domain-containing protein n=1 Tax=Mobiluncus sp. TaxID=47293 RepID=UPI002590B3CB|nr:CBS domain-containing protein [Mobiluncus sp.]MCI6585212.1 CBS domain-containing protein [Mobiluncus sp.]